MICALLSDIHANQEALEAVFAALADMPIDAVYCTGDLIGYNPDPEACMDALLERTSVVVRGNHDKAVAGLLPLEWFNEAAKKAALWTRQNLRPESLKRLEELAAGPVEADEGILLCHGTPMDEDEYMMDMRAVRGSFEYMERHHPECRFCVHGHTHQPLVAGKRTGETPVILDDSGVIELERGCSYLINPGAVGQPRDGNPMASFGILDTRGMTYRNLRVDYDLQSTQRKIRRAGLPRSLAERLAEGR